MVACKQPSEPDRVPLALAPSPTPALPDLSTAEPSVQRQIVRLHEVFLAHVAAPGSSSVSRGAAYGEMGKLLMAAELYDAAEAFLVNAANLAPREARWSYYLAHVYRTKNDFERAVRFLERTIELAPDYEAASLWLGRAYLDLGRLAEAEAQFSNRYAQRPLSAAALFGLGRIALARSDYDRAAENFEAALKLDPGAGVIRYPLAVAYRAMGKNAEADVHLRLWQRNDVSVPDPFMDEVGEMLESSLAYELRGDRAIRHERWGQAASYYRRSIELAPKNAERHHKLGTALMAAGDTASASEEFRRALELAPRLAKADLGLGVISGLGGNRREAFEHFQRAVASDPSDVEARLLLADALRTRGSASDSLDHYQKALRMSPRMPRAKYGYAMALLETGRHDEARVQLSEGMQRYPQYRQFADALAQLR